MPGSSNKKTRKQENKKIRFHQSFGGSARISRGFTPHLLQNPAAKINSKPVLKGAGFTLMEILVVVALFSILSVIMVDVYLLSLKTQRQTSYRQKTLSSVRYAMETIVRQVRNAEIDYNYSGYPTAGGTSPEPLTKPENELALIDQTGRSVVYAKNADSELQVDIAGQTYNLTDAAELTVVTLDFYIDPAINPFREERCNQDIGLSGCSVTSNGCTVDEPASENLAGFCLCREDSDCRQTQRCDLTAQENPAEGLCLPFNRQPRVTISMGFKPSGSNPDEQKLIFLQTTVSSRIYKR